VALTKEKFDKEAVARAAAEAEAARLRDEVTMLKREMQGIAKSARSADKEAGNRDVRLNRALEEARRLKEKLAEERANKGDEIDGARRDAARLEAKVARLERQKAELLAAFKKQLKLIDVLKRQKIHIEAARALAFTEEEFMKTLDWGAA